MDPDPAKIKAMACSCWFINYLAKMYSQFRGINVNAGAKNKKRSEHFSDLFLLLQRRSETVIFNNIYIAQQN